MAVAFIFEVPGGTKAMYDASIQKLEAAGAGAPKGRLYHVAGPMDNGWRVVDVWESEADMNAFMQGSLMGVLKEVGMPPPQMKSWTAYNIIKG